MTTYNIGNGVNESLVRKLTSLATGGTTVPTVGQVWPRGNRGAT